MDAASSQPRARRIALPGRGGTMAALEFGPQDRPVDVVFCHANGFNARTYRTILAPLASELRILAPDARGHGMTDLPVETEGRRNWLGLRDDLLALLDALDLSGVALAGHSMGGTTSLLAAAQAPERVRALALFDPVVLPRAWLTQAEPGEFRSSPLVQGAARRRAEFPSRAAAIEAYAGRGAFRSWTPQMLADYVADGFRDRADGMVVLSCPPAWEVSNFVSQKHDPWDAFARSRCPIRIFRAETASTARIEDELPALTADARVTVETVPGTTHFVPMERPDVVQAALRWAASA